ncbi:MAG: methyltransferase domain-containing protein [Sphingomicrobium sp.]
MSAELFDMKLRALRRDRAARTGSDPFLHERAFEDCLDRLSLIQRDFASALIVGCPDPSWPDRLRKFVPAVEVVDPGVLFAEAAGGSQVIEDSWTPDPATHDLCIAVGTLDTVNALPNALLAMRFLLREEGLLLGAMSGGETLPQLRSAMRAADEVRRAAAPHVHPRIEPAALAGLLSTAGFEMPVVDVDRVQVSYAHLCGLVADLRAMGATNILSQRSKVPLSRSAYSAAVESFARSSVDGRVKESFEILHFAGWTAGSTGPLVKHD